MSNHLLVFGPGYTAAPIMARVRKAGWVVTCSYRSPESKSALEAQGYHTVPVQAGGLSAGQLPISHILTSVAPDEDGDPILSDWKSWVRQQFSLRSLHYLSSTNVYGNHNGGWVDETTAENPSLERGKRRLAAEHMWQQLAADMGCATFVYRLAGIYGPDRNALHSLQVGKARRIIKPGQFFGRIHRDDICETVCAAMTGTHQGGVFNVADDRPTPPQEVILAAADMLGIDAPPEENFEGADMSPMARSFYAENKRVKNDKIKTELGVKLKYPSYIEGLKALLADMKSE